MSKLPPDLPPDPVIEAYKKDIDRTLLRESLKRTPEERARALMALQRVAEEFRRAGREARRARAARVLQAARRCRDFDAMADLEALLAERENRP